MTMMKKEKQKGHGVAAAVAQPRPNVHLFTRMYVKQLSKNSF